MRQLSKGLLSMFLVLTLLITAFPVSASAQEELSIRITPSVTAASVGDVIEYTITATGNEILAMEFKLALPEGLRYVENSAAVPEGLCEILQWPNADWTEETKKWTGFNNIGVEIPADTVILTFRAVAEAEGTYAVELENLLPYGESCNLVEPTLDIGTVTVSQPKPTKVTGLKATKIEEKAFTVTWDALENADVYWVYVNGFAYTSTTGTSLTVTKRSPETAYRVQVIARMNDNTLLSQSDAETVVVQTLKSKATTAVADESSIALTWDNTNITKTWIYLGTTVENMQVMYGSTGGSYIVPNLKPATTYYIRLAHSIGGNFVMDEDILTVKTLVPKTPAKVTGLKATKIEETAFTLTWDALVNADVYWVYINGFAYTSTAGTSLTVTGRSPETVYRVQVIARMNGNTLQLLKDAETVSVQTLKMKTITATADERSITLTWDNTNITKTWIYLGTTEANMQVMYGCTDGSYIVPNLKPDTTYYIRLAHSVGGNFVMSDQILKIKTAAVSTADASATVQN